MAQTVSVKRTELAAPDLTDPNRKIVQIEYQVGELPPRFLYIDKKEWTKEKEAAEIKKDLAKRMAPPGETVEI
jgi:hypothetical protein